MNRVFQFDEFSPFKQDKQVKMQTAQRLLVFLAAIAFAATVGIAQGSTIYNTTVGTQDNIIGERQSGAAQAGYYVGVNAGTVGVGGGSNARRNSTPVVGLTLPTLAAGETIEGAELTFNITGIRDQGSNNILGSLDTYLLDIADPSSTGTTFFYESGTVQTSAGGFDVEFLGRTTRSELGVSTSAGGIDPQLTFTPPRTITYVLTGDALDLLQSFYTGNTPNQTNAYLRFNQTSNQNLQDLDRYAIDPSSVQLSITAVPEPASLVLLAAGGALMMSRRKP